VARYDAYDCSWSWDGDLSVGEDGDLADNKDDAIQSLVNEIRTVIRSETGDWQFYPQLGADLSDFLGEPNNRETGKAIEDRIISSLVGLGIVTRGDLSVRVMPVEAHAVMITITVNAEATADNSLVVGEPILVSLVYDSIEDSVFFLSVGELERQGA